MHTTKNMAIKKPSITIDLKIKTIPIVGKTLAMDLTYILSYISSLKDENDAS